MATGQGRVSAARLANGDGEALACGDPPNKKRKRFVAFSGGPGPASARRGAPRAARVCRRAAKVAAVGRARDNEDAACQTALPEWIPLLRVWVRE